MYWKKQQLANVVELICDKILIQWAAYIYTRKWMKFLLMLTLKKITYNVDIIERNATNDLHIFVVFSKDEYISAIIDFDILKEVKKSE